ncbi:MAG: hypothetical protein IJS84_01385, partial [Spirochaetales bacterium]|nr:hypothetical protein [Spirochaetales bacterium]
RTRIPLAGLILLSIVELFFSIETSMRRFHLISKRYHFEYMPSSLSLYSSVWEQETHRNCAEHEDRMARVSADSHSPGILSHSTHVSAAQKDKGLAKNL